MYYEVTSDYDVRVSKCWGRVTDNWNRSDIKTFYTKPNAERFVLENKPCLSLEDVLKLVRTVSDAASGEDNKKYLNSRLQELTKQKLNKQ